MRLVNGHLQPLFSLHSQRDHQERPLQHFRAHSRIDVPESSAAARTHTRTHLNSSIINDKKKKGEIKEVQVMKNKDSSKISLLTIIAINPSSLTDSLQNTMTITGKHYLNKQMNVIFTEKKREVI